MAGPGQVIEKPDPVDISVVDHPGPGFVVPVFGLDQAKGFQLPFLEIFPLQIEIPDYGKLNRVHIEPVSEIAPVFCPPAFLRANRI